MRSTAAHLVVVGVVAIVSTVVPAHAGLVTNGLVVRLETNGIKSNDAGAITSWDDESGNSLNAAVESTTPPTVSAKITPTGRKAIFFNGATDTGTGTTGQYLKIGATSMLDMTDGITWYIVYQTNLPALNRRPIGSGYADIDPGTGTKLNNLAWGSTDGVGPSNTVPNTYRATARTSTGALVIAAHPPESTNTTDFFIGGGVWDNGADTISAILVTGKYCSRSVVTAVGADGVPTGHNFTRIGAAGGSTNPSAQAFFNGSIAAVLIYNRKLTVEEQKDVEEYLRVTYLSDAIVAPDYDRNCYVNKADFEIFSSCFTGPMIPRAETPLCVQSDFDEDGDVDQADFGLFQRCYGGDVTMAVVGCDKP